MPPRRGAAAAGAPRLPPPPQRAPPGGRVLDAWGTTVVLDAAQTTQLDAFLRALRPRGVPPPDAVVALKFMRARDGDAGAAAASYATSAAFRAAAGFDRPLASLAVPFEPLLLQSWPQFYVGRDALSRPVVFERAGGFDPREATGAPGRLAPDDVVTYYLKHLAFQSALMREVSAQEGRLVESMCHVIDVTGASLRAHLSGPGRDIFTRLATAADAHFPETLGKLLIINTSSAFPLFWAVVKGFVDGRTRSKIEVYGEAPTRDFFAAGGWPARVRELMGGTFPEQMYPGRAAGTRTAPWAQEPWRLLGYPGPAPVRAKAEGVSNAGNAKGETRAEGLLRLQRETRGAEASPARVKAAARAAPQAPQAAQRAPERAASPPLPPPPPPPPPVTPPPVAPAPAAGGAGRLIWELAQNRVAETRAASAAAAAAAAAAPLPHTSSFDDVAAWMDAAAQHGGADQWRPPSSFGFNSAPGSPSGGNATHARRRAPGSLPHTPGALPPRLSLLAPLDENEAVGSRRRQQQQQPVQVAADAVWRAVMDVAASMDLFGEDGVDVRESGAEREQGWACPACSRRFAFQDLALAQACEASHGGGNASGGRRRHDALAAARRRLGRGASSSDSSGGDSSDAAADDDDVAAADDAQAFEVARRRRQSGSPRARRNLQAGMRAAGGPAEAKPPPMTWHDVSSSKWGGARRDPAEAAEAAERIAAAGGLTTDGWTEAAVLGATPPHSPPAAAAFASPLASPPQWRHGGVGSPPPGVRGGGRVQTSADVLPPERGGKRRAACSVRGPSCAAPGAGNCVLQ